MKERKMGMFLLCMPLIVSVVFVYGQEKPKIAVVPLAGRSDDVLVSYLTNVLVQTKKYRVMERSRIDALIEEMSFQRTQISSAQAARLGRLLGVSKLITGEKSSVSVSIRLIDVETGEIEASSTLPVSESYSPETLAKALLEDLLYQ
jgi:curli biogenesis system outer membrane secretion channel CsgG